ncbi:hypothetical protein GF351_01630 [Candidatus Woesearchaeota archaeon]|nr:hypothetical protein [Candidatus Woesearchaeota archaeon]
MRIIHSLDGKEISKETSENAGFLLTNRIGGFCFFRKILSSKFEGFFFSDKEDVYKVIESVSPEDSGEVSELRNSFSQVSRKRGDNQESYFVPEGINALCYELKDKARIRLSLDVRKGYDTREWGREYSITKDKGCLIISFTKRTDKREDSTDSRKEYSVYLAIAGDIEGHEEPDRWVKKHYEEDYERHSYPNDRYVYEATVLKGKRFVFAASADKASAVREAMHVLKNLKMLKRKRDRSVQRSGIKIKDKEISMAYICAKNSLQSLVAMKEKETGIFAGLPWFFQFWGRDEAVSLKALLSADMEDEARSILLRDVVNIQEDGRVPNRFPSTETGSADAVGWVFKRIQDLIAMDKIKVQKKDTGIRDWLRYSIEGLLEKHTKQGFAWNSPKETWMDTEFGGDNRAGARIEIQALRLNMYRLMHELSEQKRYAELQNELRQKVREKFWNKEWLADGLDDWTIRPNIFIAAYAYPEMLSRKEWTRCFDAALKQLWLRWGGLSTIEKNNALFCPESTGEDVQSYHRGDSWFWINNLAAMVMHRISRRRYRKNIDRILKASAEEILWHNAAGHHSETSSAGRFKGTQCPAMAWSSAMFIELVEEIE